MKYLKLCYNHNRQQHRNVLVLLLNSNNRRSIINSQRPGVSYYSTSGGGTTASTPLPPRAPPPPQQQRQQPPPPPPPPSSSKLLPTTILLLGGAGAGLGAYYYYDPNADVFKQAKGLLGMGDEKKKMNVSLPTISKASALNESSKQQQQQKASSSSSAKATTSDATKQQAEQKQQQKSTPTPMTAAIPPPPLQKPASQSSSSASSIPASATAASAIKTPQQQTQQQQQDIPTPDFVPKNVLITALRAQQEALSESHDAKVKTIQSEYDRRLNNAAQVIEAERVVELRGKYEKASAALEAIEKGIEARTTQNERAKRLRSLWAQINALHARVNHPEYHSSTITTIDKSALLRSVQVPDKFVTQMVESLPTAPVHSLESLKSRFYGEVEPVAKSVGLIGEGEGFSLWKYLLGRVFSGGVLDVVKMEKGDGDGEARKPKASSPVQSTADALNSAKRSLDQSDLLSAAIAINQLKGLPKQVASDWLADARTLLETNQTLFVLMTYAASNNVF